MRLGSLTLLAAVGFAAETPAQSLPADARAERNVEYGPHERNRLDLYVPRADKPLPLIIWVHGGGWEAGSKEGNPALNLLARGYAVAGINYRYSKHAPFPAQIHDCKAAVRFLRANAGKYRLDPDRFGVMGASAGGHLVALLGTSGDVPDLDGDGGNTGVSAKVQAVCDWFGPTDLVRLSPPAAKSNAVTRLLGGDTGTKNDVAKAADPITYVSKGDPPFLILHGDQDGLVPLNQSELLHAALGKAGVPSELVVFKGAGHGDAEFRKQLTADANKSRIGDFFDKHLKK